MNMNLFKRVIVFISFLSLTLPFTCQAAASFGDVPENTEHFAAIEYLKSKGVVSGYPDGTFGPKKPINRAEATKILILATNPEVDINNLTLPFPDVKPGDWFYDFVRKAFALKIVEGYPDKTFKPANTINLAESLKMILLTFKVDLPAKNPEVNPYPDVDKNFWYSIYAQYAKEKELASAQDDGKLHGEKEMNREDFAEVVYRLMYIKESNLEEFPISANWPTFSHPSDGYSLKYPFDWQKINAGDQTIFWKQDVFGGQVSFVRIYPNSATVVGTLDPNTSKLTLDQYVTKIQYEAGAEMQSQTLHNYPMRTVTLTKDGLKDFYFELPNKTILILYTQTGSGLLKLQLQNEIEALVESVRHLEGATPQPENKETLLSQIRANLLVAGKGQELLNFLSDRVIIETDTIGIGTGPVDYYYTAQYDVTIKYERNSDTLLALKEGKTSAF
jgi:hypothetical protein